MNKKLFVIAAIFIIVVGTLWHFVYGWSGNNFWVGLIAPVNESVWEHMKLVFFPMLIFGAIEYYYLRKNAKNFFFSLFVKQIFAIIFIIVFFYLYNFYTKKSILALDISSFVLAVVLAEFIFYKLIVKKKIGLKYEKLAKILLIVLLIFFLYATVSPPKNILFEDPVTQTYSIEK